MDLNNKFVTKFDPIEQFQKLGPITENEKDYVTRIMPNDFQQHLSIKDRLMLFAASGQFFHTIGNNYKLLIELFSILIRMSLNSNDTQIESQSSNVNRQIQPPPMIKQSPTIVQNIEPQSMKNKPDDTYSPTKNDPVDNLKTRQLSGERQLLEDVYYLPIDSDRVLNYVKQLGSEANPKRLINFMMSKENHLSSTSSTFQLPNKQGGVTKYRCTWSWGDNSYTAVNESRNKKDAELSCCLQLLKQKFPPNWSYGQMFEYVKVNWDKKRKRADGYSQGWNEYYQEEQQQQQKFEQEQHQEQQQDQEKEIKTEDNNSQNKEEDYQPYEYTENYENN